MRGVSFTRDHPCFSASACTLEFAGLLLPCIRLLKCNLVQVTLFRAHHLTLENNSNLDYRKQRWRRFLCTVNSFSYMCALANSNSSMLPGIFFLSFSYYGDGYIIFMRITEKLLHCIFLKFSTILIGDLITHSSDNFIIGKKHSEWKTASNLWKMMLTLRRRSTPSRN